MQRCNHLIIGGGIIGCSLAYHLCAAGETGVVLLEKAGLTEGATWHAAGLVGQLRGSRNTTRMLQRSVALYDRIGEETGMETDWKKVGSLRLAASPDRVKELYRLHTMATSFGLEMHLLSPSEALAMFPYIDSSEVLAAAFIPSDGYIDPSGIALAIAKAARMKGAQIHQHVEVLSIDAQGSPYQQQTLASPLQTSPSLSALPSLDSPHGFRHCRDVAGVQTSQGRWVAEKSTTICAGMWSHRLGRQLGVSIPACAVEHQYIVSEPIPGFPKNLPTLRDPDRLVYYKPDAGGRLLVGGYEEDTLPFEAPREFVRTLLSPNHDRFAPLAENAQKVTPVMGQVGIRTFVNGPIPYSADGDFVMGRAPGFNNLFVCSGFLYGIAAGGGAGEKMAEWILDGDKPSLNLWPLDIRRFSSFMGSKAFMHPRATEHYAHHYKLRFPNEEPRAARGLRRSPVHHLLLQQGAVMGSKNGWERPLWFQTAPGEPREDQLSWGASHGWMARAAEEHRAIREGVALIDQTSFAKFELVGEGALDALQHLCVSNMDKPPGSVVYTQMCNDRGGVECDLTITRLAHDHFYIVTGAGFGVHDADWIMRGLDRLSASSSSSSSSSTATSMQCRLHEVTSAWALLNLVGPLARQVLSRVAEEDVGAAAFPFSSMRQLHVGAAPVRALRIGYVGELGWELHVPTEFCAYVYELLMEAGKEEGIRNAGYRAIESCRLEKGYLYWSSDLTPDHTPYEAGLGGRVHLKKEARFRGRAALEAAKARPLAQQLCTFVSDQPLPVFGGETIRLGDEIISLATSAGFGYTCNQTIIYAYLPAKYQEEVDFVLESMNARYPIRKVQKTLYDPSNSRLI